SSRHGRRVRFRKTKRFTRGQSRVWTEGARSPLRPEALGNGRRLVQSAMSSRFVGRPRTRLPQRTRDGERGAEHPALHLARKEEPMQHARPHRLRRAVAFAALAALLGLAALTLSQCTLVGDSLTGVNLDGVGPTSCVKQCNDFYAIAYKREQRVHD